MNIAKQIGTSLFTVAIVVTAALAYKPAAHSSTLNPAAANDMQAVTIVAQRMTAAQKAAYDLEQNSIATLTISAKPMSNAEKAAFDRANGI